MPNLVRQPVIADRRPPPQNRPPLAGKHSANHAVINERSFWALAVTPLVTDFGNPYALVEPYLQLIRR